MLDKLRVLKGGEVRKTVLHKLKWGLWARPNLTCTSCEVSGDHRRVLYRGHQHTCALEPLFWQLVEDGFKAGWRRETVRNASRPSHCFGAVGRILSTVGRVERKV